MTIKQYLQCKHRCLLNPKYIEKVPLLEWYKNLFNKEKISFVSIYSANISPKIVRLGQNSFLVWDNHFWNLYEHYLSLLDISLNPLIQSKTFYNIGESLNAIVLANVLDQNPFLSLSFARMYQQKGAIWGLYNKEFFSTQYTDAFWLTMFLSQTFVLVHELTHHKLTIQPNYRTDLFNRVLSNGFSNGKPYSIESENDAVLKRVIEEFNKTIYQDCNTQVLEEFICDLNASREVSLLAIKMLSNEVDINRIAEIVINIVAQISYFQSWIRQLQENWKRIYTNWKKFGPETFRENYYFGLPSTSYSETAIRFGFIHVLLNGYFETKCGCTKPVDVKTTDVLDVSSKYMLSFDFTSNLLRGEANLQENLSAIESRKMRDAILGWEDEDCVWQ